MAQAYAKVRAVTICHDYAGLLSSPQQARIIATTSELLKSTRISAQEKCQPHSLYRPPQVHTKQRIIALSSQRFAAASKLPAPVNYTENPPNLHTGWALHNNL